MISAGWRRPFEPPEHERDDRRQHEHGEPGHVDRRMEHVRELEAGPASLDNLLVPIVLRRDADSVDEHQADDEGDREAWT
jgi:hypothetical protein